MTTHQSLFLLIYRLLSELERETLVKNFLLRTGKKVSESSTRGTMKESVHVNHFLRC